MLSVVIILNNVNSNDKDPKFQFRDHVRISNYKNGFAERYTPNLPEEVFVIKKVKNTVPWTLMISMLKKLLELFMKVNSKNQNKKNLGQTE